MAAVLLSNAPSGSIRPSASQSNSQPPAPTPPPHKSFRQMVRASIGETLRTATRSKAKSRITESTSNSRLANETSFAASLGLSTPSSSRMSKEQERTTKGKEKESAPRPSTDTTASQTPSEQHPGALKRLSSRSGFPFNKKSAAEPTVAESSRTRSGGGWTSFMTPSQSAGSISTPALHLASDPSNGDTQEAQMVSSTTSVGPLISPPRARRPTVSSRDSGEGSGSPTGSKKPPPASGATRQAPSPQTLVLASSSRNGKNVRIPPSPSTPSLPSNSMDTSTSTIMQTPTKGIIRRPSESGTIGSRPQPPSTPDRTVVNGERSASRSGSASGSGSRSSSPAYGNTGLGIAGGRRPGLSMTSSPSPPPRRSSDRRPSFEQRAKPYASMSTSHLPLGAGPSAIPAHHNPLQRNSRERSSHVPPPIVTGQPPSSVNGLYQRRNSSSTSFASAHPSSPPSNVNPRTQSPVYRTHGRNTSTSSLLGGGSTLSPHRESMRAAASFVVKEMAKPPPAVLKSLAVISPYGGLAGAPAGVKIDPWEEVERRLAPLGRLERIWGRSGISGTLGSHSNLAVNAGGSTTVLGGNEEKERRVFCEALRDGYVLAQLINKLNPTSPLPIPRVDSRDDGYTKASNIIKFRDAAKDFITKSGPDGKDLAKEMFGKDDLVDGGIDCVARVARVISILAALKTEASGSQGRWVPGKDSPGPGRSSTDRESSGGRSGGAAMLNGARSSPTTRLSSPSPAADRMSPEFSSDSQGSASAAKLDREMSAAGEGRGLDPSLPSPLPIPHPRRPLSSERRSSGGHYKLSLSPPSPPPAPPRSLLRGAPSFGSNRVSVASSAQTQSTEHTTLFDVGSNHRSSNRFGTVRTMNTIHTDASSIVPDGSNKGSWGHEDAANAALALGLADTLDAAAGPPSNPRRKSYDLKTSGQPSGLGLALQAHPRVSSADFHQDGGLRQRRDRRSSEVAADLAKVLEETTTDMEGSIKPANRRLADHKVHPPAGLNLGKAKWPEDFVGLFGNRQPLPRQAPFTPDLDDDPFIDLVVTKQWSSSPEREPSAGTERTPRGKNSMATPITIITAASRQVTPQEELDETVALSVSQNSLGYRRPTHRAGSQSVDVLLPRLTTERRISMERRVSAERTHRLLDQHDRDSSSGSMDSQHVGDPAVRRPLRRSSTRGHSGARHAIYLPKRPVEDEDPSGLASVLPSVSSLPAVSHIRVPFPRTSSGERASPSRKPLASRVPSGITLEATTRDMGPPPTPPKDAESTSPTRPSFPRQRYMSELETPRMTRRGSSSVAMPTQQRRGSAGADDVVPSRPRFESTRGRDMGSSTNLIRMSSLSNGSNIRRTIIVKEDGRTPMHYQLGNCIGKGQFGAVYRALNLNTGQMVAVKRIRLDGLPESEVTQLMKEVDLLKKLQHPSIVSYEGMVRDDDSLDIVLEYVENGSLGQTLKTFNKFNEKLVATYVTKILEGLHYLHEQQVVHCDLKAANILSTKNGNIKLSDFGVSLALNAMETAMETHNNNVAGTPNWMAPEVIELKGASTASDIWSLGCTIVELLTGRPPYSEIGNSLSVMFRIVEDDQPPIPEECSEPLRNFLSLCFKKNPAERPSAEILFEHPWLKRTWGLNKDLHPEDSVPFLRRVSTDLQARQLSIQNLAEGYQALEAAQKASPVEPDEPEFVIKPHSFVKTTFSKHVTCKVCLQSVKKSAVLCEECSLICHSTCAKDAPAHCDVRAQLRLYAQFSNHGARMNGSPRVSAPSGLPSPSIPFPHSPTTEAPPLSSSPSFHNKIFPWKRNSKASTPDGGSSTPLSPTGEDRGSQRRSGGLFFGRRSEDRSRTRRDSMQRESTYGGSQNSASTRSHATGQSQGSTFRGRPETAGSGITRRPTISQPARLEVTKSPQSPPPGASLSQQTELPSDATRRRRTRRESQINSKDCTIQ